MKNRRKSASKQLVDKDLGRKPHPPTENRATASHTSATDLPKRSRDARLDPPRGFRGCAGGREELIEAQRVRREERIAYLNQIRAEFIAELGGSEPRGARRALLETIISATFEIYLMTSRAARSFVSAESLTQLATTRGELRRSLRALGLVRDSGEASEDPNAPPPNATDEEKRQWSKRYVEGLSVTQ